MYTLALAMGLGCGIGCGSVATPFLTAYVIGKRKDLKESLKATLIFSLGKILIMILLGGISAYIGQALISETKNLFGLDVKLIFNAISVLLGSMIIIKNVRKKKSCRSCGSHCKGTPTIEVPKNQSLKNKENIMLFVTGIIYGMTPCVPLGSMLLIAVGLPVWEGMMLLGFFGVVTCISPVIIQSIIAGMIAPRMIKDLSDKVRYVSILAGGMLIYLGINSVIKLFIR
ncbi:sulfite exporter TauE/SafE family protein [Clostridium aestuarii]|uniref:Sulfite exporter TauE/SafE family protein n=1 Tax=Clostridium aestuarii TaxID=338193 RepID=A0ABT4D062_9CLOT|nr:sulfite exporter TauE/SafE family protein [Clostridium aestuarii]MCY6484620.1 sulfite exporter TauE/SafE family protein [Clostridium aestuarii]